MDDPRFGGAPLPFHSKIADATGASRVLELINDGVLHVHEPIVGVITNSPTYDRHVTNLRNHLGLTQATAAAVTIGDTTLTPLGGGSGLLGLPGDFTPPSRFIRAVALAASVRPAVSRFTISSERAPDPTPKAPMLISLFSGASGVWGYRAKNCLAFSVPNRK